MMSVKIKNCQITVSFLLVSLLAFLAFMDKSGSILIAVFGVLFHEIGHIFAMYKFNCLPQKINIEICNIGINDSLSNLNSPKKNGLIILAGPLVNLVLALFSYILNLFIQNDIFINLLYVNLALAIFNLLPIEGLDGGSLLYIFLCCKTNIYKAQKTLTVISLIFVLPMFFFGFFMLLQSRYNFSLLLTSCFLIWNILSRK